MMMATGGMDTMAGTPLGDDGTGTSDRDSTSIHKPNPGDNTLLHPQCEILPLDVQGAIGAKILYDRCLLYPGHPQFMTWTQFEQQTLPECITEADKAYLKYRFDMTVQIGVRFTSHNRPDKFLNSDAPYPYSNMKGRRTERVGTGLIELVFPPGAGDSTDLDEKCPCPECTNKMASCEPKTRWWQVIVATAAHVIYDTDEACKAIVSLFMEEEDQLGDHVLYGIKVFDPRRGDIGRNDSDRIRLLCITHDEDLATQLSELNKGFKPFNNALGRWGTLGFVVSHPHGVAKRISMGEIHERYTDYHNSYRISGFADNWVDITDGEKRHATVKQGTRITWSAVSSNSNVETSQLSPTISSNPKTTDTTSTPTDTTNTPTDTTNTPTDTTNTPTDTTNTPTDTINTPTDTTNTITDTTNTLTNTTNTLTDTTNTPTDTTNTPADTTYTPTDTTNTLTDTTNTPTDTTNTPTNTTNTPTDTTNTPTDTTNTPTDTTDVSTGLRSSPAVPPSTINEGAGGNQAGGSNEETQQQSLELTCDAIVKIPRSSNYTFRSNYLGDSGYAFPIGSQFVSVADGTNLPLPTNVELSFPSKSDLVADVRYAEYFNYDIPTCPGSSGAFLIHSDDVNTFMLAFHNNSHLGRSTNLNLSGYSMYF